MHMHSTRANRGSPAADASNGVWVCCVTPARCATAAAADMSNISENAHVLPTPARTAVADIALALWNTDLREEFNSSQVFNALLFIHWRLEFVCLSLQ